jgi:tetratricopeptide (TPR) repeat protein
MNHAPHYIYDVMQAVPKDADFMERSRRVLAIEPQKEADKDYIYGLSVVFMLNSAPPQLIIDRCEAYLPLVTIPECRASLQSNRIWSYEELGQHDKALALRIEQAEEHPRRSYYYLELARTYKEQKDNENAIKYYEQYIGLRTDGADTDEYVELAELYEAQKDFKSAAKYHTLAAAWEARFSSDHWRQTGRALSLDGQIDEAMFYFKVALKIDPKDAYAHYYMGHAYGIKKDKYRALHHYTEALKIDPNFAAVHLNLGALEFNEEGDIKKAIAYFETALEKDTTAEFSLILYRNLRNMYKLILDHDKSDYYRGKIFELAGFPTDTGSYLDSLGGEKPGERSDYYFDDDDDDEDDKGTPSV